MKFRLVLSFLFIFSTHSLFAMEVDKNSAALMIDQMVAKGLIAKVDATKAKEDLFKMDTNQWKEINKQGRKLGEEIERNLASQ